MATFPATNPTLKSNRPTLQRFFFLTKILTTFSLWVSLILHFDNPSKFFYISINIPNGDSSALFPSHFSRDSVDLGLLSWVMSFLPEKGL
ncbi:unnamed protein product [Citrullus colocynthis]|uniref:Uncharacterized protein n=1 Tax=Citrullus colocynthis TaxID=252529 RepID=A0ABP0Z3Y8_9ROSI